MMSFLGRYFHILIPLLLIFAHVEKISAYFLNVKILSVFRTFGLYNIAFKILGYSHEAQKGYLSIFGE